MSAIFGFIIRNGYSTTDALLQMSKVLAHRGRDEEWYAVNKEYDKSISAYRGNAETNTNLPHLAEGSNISMGIGFRGLRLSETELEQPVTDNESGIIVAFDGVIYNRIELIKTLGCDPICSSTMLLLTAYKKWGIDFVKMLNGMFVIELFDKNAQLLYLVRDQHGTIPLFYYHADDNFVWASEIKGVLKHNKVAHEVDLGGLLATYYLQTPVPPATCFKDIYQLPPGYWLTVDCKKDSVRLHQYWDIPFGKTDYRGSFADAGTEFAERLRLSVKKTTDSKANIASLLSGGLDSALITTYAKLSAPALACYTFAIDGSGKGNDELPQAKEIAEHLDVKQYVHWLHEDEIMNNLYEDIRHIEEPYSDIEIFMNTSKYLSNEGYKIILNGAAADHIFGGESNLFWKWKHLKNLNIIEPAIPPITTSLKKIKNILQLDTVWKYFANAQPSMRIYQIKELIKGTPLTINQNLMTGHDETDFRNDIETLFYHNSTHFAAHNNWRNNLYGMRYGVEMRYPFFDPTLTEWVSKLPIEYRYSSRQSKPLIREAVRQTIFHPEANMPKKGYRVPREALPNNNKTLDRFLKSYIEKLKQRDIFNNTTIDNWWKEYTLNSLQNAKIWLLATTEIWLQTYID